MKSCIVLLLLLLGIFGCAPEYHWTKPSVSQQEFAKESYECQRYAKERVYFERGWIGHLTVQNFFDRCLLAKGYYKE